MGESDKERCVTINNNKLHTYLDLVGANVGGCCDFLHFRHARLRVPLHCVTGDGRTAVTGRRTKRNVLFGPTAGIEKVNRGGSKS